MESHWALPLQMIVIDWFVSGAKKSLNCSSNIAAQLAQACPFEDSCLLKVFAVVHQTIEKSLHMPWSIHNCFIDFLVKILWGFASPWLKIIDEITVSHLSLYLTFT